MKWETRLLGLLCMACTMLPAYAGSWQNNQSVGGFNRVHIYTPDGQSAIGNGRALLVVLHGCTHSIDAYLTANLEAAAETYGMVVAVPDAMNKAGFGCWSYWQGAKSRSAGDYKNLISLANTLSADGNYGIDANQIYIAGLSSGAAFANTTACIAPDVFAGMGVSAGPSIGTSSGGAIGSCEQANVALRCEQYAGSYSSYLETQVASIAHGDADTTVDQCYNRQNAEGMAQVYGVSELPGTNVIGSGGRTADEHVWQDGRVSMLWLNGVDHAWSGGAGASGSYVNGQGINYALYLGEYFLHNNARVDRNQPPEIQSLVVTESDRRVTVAGQASDAEGTVAAVFVQLRDDADNLYSYESQSVTNGDFSVTTPVLPDALYFVSVNAADNDGAVSDTITDSIRVGPPPPPTAPELRNVQLVTDGQCATVSGEAVDINQDLATVTAAFETVTVNAQLNGPAFTASACELPGKEQQVTVTATDSSGRTDATVITFQIDAGVVATLDTHIADGRLDYTNYANCYLEYGSAPFKLDEIASGAQQCRWEDDDSSCTGPVQACRNGGADGDPGAGDGDTVTCATYTTANYYHKVAGRAYSTGYYYAPDYFATGSDDPLSGSTWGNSTLSSVDGETWVSGSCP
ncbi:PHB depolymerase family esterase [Alteromonas sp. ASW11-19]|uniref:PHB depolymerase family esterase n=1 Tax=Alteromonas salexigens TaxID=2982530 RepID=A0ABT2VMH6_9ALTE|nr:PHB depolymerase family esterase [Alteromonas salexigens]MCU7553436.1 PHB depolymerase family esterase [Alteromonas salexigens]